MNINFDRTRLALLLLLAALLGIGLWAYRGVGNSLREIRTTGLQTLLNTQVGTLEQWISERRHEAEQLAADAELGAGIVRLAAGRGGDRDGVVGDILNKARPIGVTAVLVIDPRGRILAASETERTGRSVTPDFLAHLAPVLRGQSSFVRPYSAPGASGSREIGRAWVAAPVRNADGKIAAVLALGSPVDKGFAGLFMAARPGESGEALVFDAEGWLLSPSRHAGELAQRGLAPQMALPDSEARLTLLANEAVARRGEGGEGILLTPYPNYLGRDVIGAWRWLREHDIGVAIELEASEAYAPLTYLQIGFGVVLVLIFGVWLSGFLSPAALAGLLRRDGRARQMGPYRLLRQIGEGAISNVYLAQHRMLKRPAAVKVLKAQTTSEEWTARFQREVQLTSSLHHPNTITIYDYGTGPGGEFWYAMEYLEGLSLADLVERYGPVPPARTAYILRQACASLWEAHSCDLVHRDIKPQNIMLCEIRGERDFVKVLDFGLVKQIGGGTRDLTAHMRILGTPLYMSPERIRNPSDADGRADIYALGAVGFFLLTGKRLFETETEHDLTYHVLHTLPRLASECSPFEVPAELDALIGRCLEKDPAARPKNIAEVAGALDGLLVHKPWTRAQIDAWWQKNWVSESDPGRRFTAPAS